MEQPVSPKKIAVLIDAENTALSTLKAALAEIAGKGQITLQRAYADWSRESPKKWRDALYELAIQPVHHFACTKGKNASDGAMIIDAMDLLYTKEYDAFALVTSDSDFSILALRLRESGKWVIGLGEKKTPASFALACNEFVYTDNLAAVPTATNKPAAAKALMAAKNSVSSSEEATTPPAQTVKTATKAEPEKEVIPPSLPSASPSPKKAMTARP